MRHALVAGGAGFIGSHLVEALIDRGAIVTVIDNLITGNRENLASLTGHPLFDYLDADISRLTPEWIDDVVNRGGILHGVDTIFNLASPASPVAYAKYPIETLHAGAMGTDNLLKMADRLDARFVMASTSEVYGDPLEHPQRETYFGNVNPVGPRSMYDEAKRYAEALTTAYHRTGTDAAIVRIFNTYGPRMAPDDGRVISTFITQALTGQPLTVTGDGQQTRSLCYVDDLVRGLIATAEATAVGPINLGNSREMTILEIADLIINLVDGDPDVDLKFTPRPHEDPSRRRPDLTLANLQLDWRPEIPPTRGLALTIDWYRRELEGRMT